VVNPAYQEIEVINCSPEGISMINEEAFYDMTDRWLDRFLEHNPTMSTWIGDHRGDDILGDFTTKGLDTRHDITLSTLSDLERMDTAEFSLDAKIDHEIMVGVLRSFRRNHENIEDHLRDPGCYLQEAMGGTFDLISKDFAPLHDRLTSALGRVKHIPRVLEEAKSNIVPQRVPPIWARTALQQAAS